MPLQQSILAIARVFELAVRPVVGYPGWQPDFDSQLLERARKLHERVQEAGDVVLVGIADRDRQRAQGLALTRVTRSLERCH